MKCALFDLEADPGEETNLYERVELGDTVAGLKEELVELRRMLLDTGG